MATSSGHDFMPGWFASEETENEHHSDIPESNARSRATPTKSSSTTPNSSSGTASATGAQTGQRHWAPRTCRICLETVLPRFDTHEELPGVLRPDPSVIYEDEEGRLIRPCRCKGSSRYVHENCLQSWRHADPSYGNRNYFQCPTCGYRYRLARMNWGRVISSKVAQVALTILILLFAIFLLGFVADPIINLYLDPWSAFMGSGYDEPPLTDLTDSSWLDHFLKGGASMGVLGFLKAFLSSPWGYLRLGGGGRRGRPARAGRDRVGDINLFVIIVGIGTFAFLVWKGVRAWSRRTLEKAGERVMDVQDDMDGDEDD